MEGSIGPKILPTILVVLPASILLAAQASVGKATAEECSIRPGSPAPQGAHWFYRVNRTDNRHCWFLSSERITVRSHARGVTGNEPSPAPTTQRDNASEPAHATPPQTTFARTAPAQMASAQTISARPAFLESLREGARAMDFAARWRDLPESVNLDTRDVAAISDSYADTQVSGGREEQMPSTWHVIEAMRAGQQQEPAVAFGSAFLAGALALGSLLLACGGFKFGRRTGRTCLRGLRRATVGLPGLRRSMCADLADLAGRGSVETRHGQSVWGVPRPTDPTHDLKTSLGELMAEAAGQGGELLASIIRTTTSSGEQTNRS